MEQTKLEFEPHRIHLHVFLRCITILIAYSFAGFAIGQDKVRIDSHSHEAIVLDEAVTLSGTASSDSGGSQSLTLSVGAVRSTVPVVHGTWVKQVALGIGESRVEVTYGRASHQIIVTRGSGIIARQSQKAKVEWDELTDEVLRKIALGTLSPEPSNSQLLAFVSGVHFQTESLIRRAYDGIADVEFVDASTDGLDVHTIRMQPDFGGIFGRSFYDCGNSELHQISEIWVGTYLRSMLRSFPTGQVASTEWAPMRKSDLIQTRIDDVAYALARTAAHEMGHSLGLVGSQGSCSWMHGCTDGHNCDQFDIDFSPTADRFAKGRYIMDPGDRTENIARLGELSTSERSRSRQPATFNSFNRFYLAIIQPPN